MKIFFFFEKISEENFISKNKLFRHKVHICILETASIQIEAELARWPMRALWLHEIKNWRFVWIDLEFHVCRYVCGFVCVSCEFPSWWTWLRGLTRRWLENFHRWPLTHKMSLDYWAHSMNFDWPIVLLRLFISNMNHSKSVCHDFKQFSIDGILKYNK